VNLSDILRSGIFQKIVTFVIIILLAIFFRQVVRVGRSAKPPKPGLFRILRFSVYFTFITLVVYQARWQLFGFMDPEFLRVQRGFDTRGDLLGSRFYRGGILDARSIPLAFDVQKGPNLVRSYPAGSMAVHLIGYHNPVFGSTGLEKALDASLMGRAIHSFSDAWRLIANVFVHRSLHGNPVVLAICRELQDEAARSLEGKTGAIVAIQPHDGAILAMASSPGFDPENLRPDIFKRLSRREDSPFLNRATHGLYPPGSSIKPLIVARAIELGVSPMFHCGPEGFYCGPSDKPVHDHEYYRVNSVENPFTGHGDIGMDEALAKSCNVYFASLGQKIGSSNLLNILQRAGLNQAVPCAGEGLSSQKAQLPDGPDLPLARTARLSIGQDLLLVTPLHLALIAGALGTDGVCFKPRYVDSAPKEEWLKIIEPQTANLVAAMMVQAVRTGTGRQAQVDGVIVGGKTGTAENASGRSHAVFIGFASWPNPQIAFAIVIEQGGLGGSAAAPIAARLIQKARTIGLLDVSPARSEVKDENR
jgi:penicillin-binding protein A